MKDIQYFAIEDADRRFYSIYNGYIGLAPYSDNAARKERNFLWQLKKSGMIENIVVAFYVMPDAGNHSQIKFGSWDRSAVDGELRMYTTLSTATWALTSSKFTLGSRDFITESRVV
jgi:hypothetical protein